MTLHANRLGARAPLGAALMVAAALTAAPAHGQSLLNSAGLGLPVEALDGRARALGSMGIGLVDSSLMPTDPGSLSWVGLATGVMAASPSWVEYSADGGQTGEFRGNRFPLLGLAYPIFGGMASIQIGSFLDQTYEVSRTGSVTVGGTAIPTQDDFTQDGAVSTLNLAFSRSFLERFSAGVTFGRYAGSLDRTLVRTYGTDEEGDIDTYVEGGVWSWVGHSVTVGGSADFSMVRVAGSVQIPSELDGQASEDTRGADGAFALPVQYRLGASAQVTPSILLHGSALLADWSGTQDDLTSGAFAHDGSGFGVGIELSRARIFGKDAPLRFGFRRAGLPFAFDDEQVTERIISGGFGLALNETNGILLAGVDLAIERGRRTGGTISENFWRATVSLLTSGF